MDRAPRIVDDGTQRLVLRERAGALELVAGSVILLSSAALETEREFGRLAAPRTPAQPAPRVLIGGLGFGATLIGGLGFGATLRGVLDVSPGDARVVVVEKVTAVERLVRGELAELAGRPLDDPRAEVVVGDVAETIAAADEQFDAILLDVDNGPHWASFRSNARLYGAAGVERARRALRPGGTFAVWSGYPADAFVSVLRGAGLAPSIVALRERGRVRARAYVGVRVRT